MTVEQALAAADEVKRLLSRRDRPGCALFGDPLEPLADLRPGR